MVTGECPCCTIQFPSESPLVLRGPGWVWELLLSQGLGHCSYKDILFSGKLLNIVLCIWTLTHAPNNIKILPQSRLGVTKDVAFQCWSKAASRNSQENKQGQTKWLMDRTGTQTSKTNRQRKQLVMKQRGIVSPGPRSMASPGATCWAGEGGSLGCILLWFHFLPLHTLNQVGCGN